MKQAASEDDACSGHFVFVKEISFGSCLYCRYQEKSMEPTLLHVRERQETLLTSLRLSRFYGACCSILNTYNSSLF